MQDRLLLKLTDILKQCAKIVHAHGIPFVSVMMLDQDRPNVTVLMRKKEECRPAFWLLGNMLHITKGDIHDNLFEDCVYQYRAYQNEEILYTDEMEARQSYVDAVLELKTLCFNFKVFVEEHEWELPWFICFETLNDNALSVTEMFTREFYSTNLHFDRIPAYTVAMYIARCMTVEDAAQKFMSEQVDKEDSPEYLLFQEYQ